MERATDRQTVEANRHLWRQTLANEEMSFERREAKRRANLLSDSTQSSAKA